MTGVQTCALPISDDNLAGEINIAIIDEAIIYSESLIDGYLRSRYSLPLSIIPMLIKLLAIDLSIFRLYSRRFHTDMPESINNKYKNSVKLLEQIQKGIVSLGIETIGTTPDLGEYRTNKTYNDRIFSKEFLGEF